MMTLPIRSEKELKQIFEKMVEYRDRFKAVGVPVFLGGCVLLGICRDGDITPWTSGLTLHFDVKYLRKVRRAFPEFHGCGRDGSKKLRLDLPGEELRIAVELVAWYPEREMMVRSNYQIPARFFMEGSFVLCRGELFPSFKMPEEYILWRYGKHWRTPINATLRNEYGEQLQYYRKVHR